MSAKAKPPSPKSIKVTVGAVSVPIYPMADGRWCIVYRPAKGAARQRVTRVTLAAAKEQAEKICLDIMRGQVSAGRLTPDQLLQAAAALQVIEPLGLTLDGLAREVQTAISDTGGASIAEMARFWARHHKVNVSRKPIGQIHEDLLKIKTKKDQVLNKRHWRSLDHDLGKFCAAFTGRTADEITAAEILEYLRGLNVQWRRRNNIHAQIVTLFRFAKDEGHLLQDRDT